MVETWEIEWNSSMIEHGVDMGTMEFIFAKGGTLSDFNYVMLNQSDDTWEPLIKAIAERDNSHPDIILKNAAPYGVDRNFRPAIPAQIGGVETAVGNKRQMRNLLGAQRVMDSQANIDAAQAAGQAPRGRDIANTGRRMAGFAQGARNIASDARSAVGPAASATAGAIMSGAQSAGRGIANAAGATKDFLARKFPGVKQRMGNFMQGVGDTARHGMEAAFGTKDPTTGKRSGGFFENAALRRGKQNELERRQTGDANKLERQRIRATQGADPSTRAKLMQEYQKDYATNEEKKKELEAQIDEKGKYAGLGGLRRKIRELGDARRAANEPEATSDPAAEAAAEGVEEAMRAGPEESAMADTAPPTEDDELTEDDLLESVGPTTEMPAPEVGTPQPVEAEKPLTSQQVYDQRIVGEYGEGEKPYGSKSKQRAMGSALQSGSYKAGTFPNTEQGRHAMAVLERLGVPRPEAAKTAAAAEKGDPEAKKVVEEAMDDDELTEDDLSDQVLAPAQVMVSAERLDLEGWGALMKQLNIR